MPLYPLRLKIESQLIVPKIDSQTRLTKGRCSGRVFRPWNIFEFSVVHKVQNGQFQNCAFCFVLYKLQNGGIGCETQNSTSC